MSGIPEAVFVPPVSIDKEKIWNEFLRDLEPWQLHRIMPHELELHDSYVRGEKQLMAIFAEVAEEDDDPPVLFLGSV